MGNHHDGVSLVVELFENPSTSRLVLESRAPVGSSASISEGFRPGPWQWIPSAAVHRTGSACSSIFPTGPPFQGSHGLPFLCFPTGVQERQLHIFQYVKLGQQVILLENGSQSSYCGCGPAVLSSMIPTSSPPRRYSPSVGTSRAPINVHEGWIFRFPTLPTMATNSPVYLQADVVVGPAPLPLPDGISYGYVSAQ